MEEGLGSADGLVGGVVERVGEERLGLAQLDMEVRLV